MKNENKNGMEWNAMNECTKRKYNTTYYHFHYTCAIVLYINIILL